MIANPNSWSVVVVGHWNRMIFTPQWVGAQLFQAENIEVQVGFIPAAPAIFQNQQVAVEIHEKRVDVRARILNEACLGQVDQIASRLLTALPNTPLVAVGINFGFHEQGAGDALLNMFNIPDGPQIQGAGWEVAERKVVRKLMHDGRTLNLSLVLQNGVVNFELNFHEDATTGDAARAVVQGHVLERYQEALEMLHQVYGVELEAGA